MTTEQRIAAAFGRIARHDPVLNCFTTLLTEKALEQARALDRRLAAGEAPGPLAGVPFAVKNLFDVEGVVTLAGSRVLASGPPASRDAAVVARLRAAGAILIGCLNMDEFAYGFTTQNAHYGDTANPHATDRIAGGSSGGSAASVAAGLVPLSLGSDTNGSIRVPASLCGIYGLKPTYGRLSRAGAYPFVASLDHVGPFARSMRDLALAYDVMQGEDAADPAQARQAAAPSLPSLDLDLPPLRIGRLSGWFEDAASSQAREAVGRVAAALGGAAEIELAESERARSAAFCISAAEGGALHLPRLRTEAARYDPAVRERLLAGALLPASVIVQAQRFRSWYRRQAASAFERFDVLLAPSTPVSAPLRAQQTFARNGAEIPVRTNLGLFTQPISFIGLPVVSVPVRNAGALPIGVQIITRPFDEALALRVCAHLERLGVTGCEELAYS